MKVYVDIFSGLELISDSYKQLAPYGNDKFKSVAFEVESSKEVISDNDYGIATNAEEESVPATADCETVIDLVHKFNYHQVDWTKKEYMEYIQEYMRNITEYLLSKAPSKVENFRSGATMLIRQILSDFKNCNIYINDTDNMSVFKAQPIIAHYMENETTPRFIYFKDAMEEIKC